MKEKDLKVLKILGAKFLEVRVSKGLSQADVSFLCDVDRGKISKIENGSANYNITTLIELCKGLEIDPKEIFEVKF